MSGSVFASLGSEFSAGQNPVFLIRTLPEKLRTPDGHPAFETWTGGLLGVLGAQLEDHAEFHRRWYLNDLLRDA
jgi:hypothetical protein